MKSEKVVDLKDELIRGPRNVTYLLLLTCFCMFMANNAWKERESSRRIAEASAQIITNNLVAPILFQDPDEIQKVLRSIAGHPSIQGALVFENDGKLMAKFPYNNGVQPEDFEPQLRFPILDQEKPIAFLQLVPRPVNYALEFMRYGLGAGILLILGLFVSQKFVRRTQTRILHEMNGVLKVARAVASGSRFDLRAENAQIKKSERIREISELTAHFDQMLDALASREKRISSFNRELEDALAKRTQELQEAQFSIVQSSRLSALGEMAAGFAHEINNPLAVIEGRARALRKLLRVRFGDEADAALEHVKKIESTTMRIAKIVHGIKAISRDGAADPFESTKVKTVVGDTLELCVSKIRAHGTDLIVDPYDHELAFDCRATQISQVLLNLLNNASDAIANLDTKWIKLSISADHGNVTFRVTDSGGGIPEAIRDKLMQPFFTTKGVGKGTGLGLSISRKIVESHHGSFVIDADSPNTSFVVTLPLKQV